MDVERRWRGLIHGMPKWPLELAAQVSSLNPEPSIDIATCSYLNPWWRGHENNKFGPSEVKDGLLC